MEDQDKIHELVSKINLVHFVSYTGAQVVRKVGNWIAVCPFHEANAYAALFIFPEKNKLKCERCGFEGNVYDYVRKLYDFQNGDAFDYLEKYYKELEPNAKPKAVYEILKVGKQEIEIRIGDRLYSLVGLKCNKLLDMQVTFKMMYKDYPPYFTSVNLIKPANREDIIREVKDLFYISEDIVREDTILLTQIIENMQREFISKIEEESEANRKVYTITKTEETKALDILHNENVFEKMLFEDLERMGWKGDPRAKEVLYCGITSCKLEQPINPLSLGTWSSGKSFGQNMIFKFVPDDKRHQYGRLTPKALGHFGKYDLVHSAFSIDEFISIEPEQLTQFREMISSGKTTTGVAMPDRLTSSIETITKEVHGPFALFISATYTEIDPETKSRFLALPIDDTIEHNRQVIEAMIGGMTLEGILNLRETEPICRKYKAMQKLLEPVVCILPDDLKEKIVFPFQKNAFKRLFIFYRSFIYTYALHRQYQRKKYSYSDRAGKRFEAIYISRQDVLDATRIMKNLFGGRVTELDEMYILLMQKLINYCEEESKHDTRKYNEIQFTARHIWVKNSSFDLKKLKYMLTKLCEDEYIIKVYGRERSANHYVLNVDKMNPFNAIELNLWDGK